MKLYTSQPYVIYYHRANISHNRGEAMLSISHNFERSRDFISRFLRRKRPFFTRVSWLFSFGDESAMQPGPGLGFA